MVDLSAVLRNNRSDFHNITPFNFETDPFIIFDFTANNKELNSLDLNNEEAFNGYVFNRIKNAKAKFAIGGYAEERVIYKRSDVFSGTENRSLHLGVDIWAEAGTPVYAPLEGRIHSFQNNNQHGDYGPTIILRHTLNEITFYTLYGHLNTACLSNLKEGDYIDKGQKIAQYGTYSENVHWPPHLHFQVITDIGNNYGDYPGVCAPGEKEKWLANCPDPNLIINLEALNQ